MQTGLHPFLLGISFVPNLDDNGSQDPLLVRFGWEAGRRRGDVPLSVEIRVAGIAG
jgi:hypothetical protein